MKPLPRNGEVVITIEDCLVTDWKEVKDLEDGFYGVRDGKVYKLNLPIAEPFKNATKVKVPVIRVAQNGDEVEQMAKKYIDTDTAYEVLTEYYHHKTEAQHKALREALDRVPAADVVEVRHGRWRILYEANPYDLEAECSVCHNEVKMPTCMGKPIYSYCPHCAAKMDEVEKNEC